MLFIFRLKPMAAGLRESIRIESGGQICFEEASMGIHILEKVAK